MKIYDTLHRILAAGLSLLLVLGMMPTVAFAGNSGVAISTSKDIIELAEPGEEDAKCLVTLDTPIEGLELPDALAGTVIEAQGGLIADFAELDAEVRWQKGSVPALPEQVRGTVDSSRQEITVTWNCETDAAQPGLHIFTVQTDEGFALAEDVHTPVITFLRESTLRIGGLGTQSNPLLVTNAAQLREIAALVNSADQALENFVRSGGTVHLKLTNHIDLGGENWTPIGDINHPFYSEFDGDGHVITGLYIETTASAFGYYGLFGHLATGSKVKHLGVENASIKVTGAGVASGGVAGHVNGTISNCYATGAVESVGSAGGIAGIISSGQIDHCYTTCMVSASSYGGGIVASVNGGTVKDCIALNSSIGGGAASKGRVTGNAVGTLTGNMAFNNISGGTWMNNTNGKDGASKTAAAINNSGDLFGLFNSWPWVTAADKLPAFGAAADMPAHLLDSSSYFAGGDGTPVNPYQIATAGQLAKLAELVNAPNTTYNTAHYILTANLDLSAYGKRFNGGAGWMPIGDHYNRAFRGTFDGGGHTITGLYINNSTPNFGGLFGFIENSTVEKLYLKDVRIQSSDAAGGITGVSSNSTIQNCAVSGSIQSNVVGGIVGLFQSTSSGTAIVQNCYSTASINATIQGGGIVALFNVFGNGSWVVKNCAALNPSITGAATEKGRIYGDNFSSPALTSEKNIAFAGMTGKNPWPQKGPGKQDGEDVSAEEINDLNAFFDGSTLGERFSSPLWTTAPGKLPGFGANAEEMPFHLLLDSKPFPEHSPGIYEIYTVAQLAKLAQLVNAADPIYAAQDVTYILKNDLDLSAYGSGTGWMPIGNTAGTPFPGTFDGNKKVITGLRINSTGPAIAGLFGAITGTVKNLGVVEMNITGNNTHAGGVASTVFGKLENCYSTGNISSTGNAGGVAGIVHGQVTHCYSTAVVDGMISGGVAGCVDSGGEVRNSAALGPSVTGTFSGRIAGKVVGGTLVCNYAFAEMKAAFTDTEKDYDKINGKNLDAADTMKSSFWTDSTNWGGSAWNASIWEIENDYLPYFSQKPSGGPGLHLTLQTRDLSAAAVNLNPANPTYTGSPIAPVAVAWNGTPLVKDTHYTIVYNNNANAGVATYTITGLGQYAGSTKSGSFTIAKATLTTSDFVYTSPASLVYDGNPKAANLVFATTGSLAGKDGYGTISTIKYQGTDATVYGHTTTAPTEAGSYEVLVTTTGGTNYNNISDFLVDGFTITRKTPVFADLHCAMPTGLIYNGTPQGPVVTAKSGLTGFGTVTTYYEGEGGTSYTRATAKPTNAGSYRVTADIALGTNYDTATHIILGTYAIGKASLTPGDFVCTPSMSLHYDTAPKSAAVMFNPVSFLGKEGYGTISTLKYRGTGTTVYGLTTTAPTNAGSYEVLVTTTGGTSYHNVSDLPVGGFTIVKGIPAITWPTGATLTYGQRLNQAGLIGANPNIYGSFAFDQPTLIPAVADSGTAYAMTFTPIDPNNYDWSGIAFTNSVPITVNKASGLMATPPGPLYSPEFIGGAHTFNLEDIGLNHSDTGAKTYSVTTVTDASGVISGAPLVTGGMLHYTINSTAAGYDTAHIVITINTANYNLATVTLAIAILPREAQAIGFTNPPTSKTYGDPSFTAAAAPQGPGGTGAITYVSSKTNVATVDPHTGEVVIVGAGQTTITATKAGDTTYNAASATYQLTINPKALTIRADDQTAMVGNAQPATYTYTITGLVNGDSEAAVLSPLPVFHCPTVDMNQVGMFPIVKDGTGVTVTDINYDSVITFVGGTLTVTPATSTGGGRGNSSNDGNNGSSNNGLAGHAIKIFGVNIPYTVTGGIASLDFTSERLDTILAAAKQETIAIELSGSIGIQGLDIGFIPAWFAQHPNVTIIIQSSFGGVYLNNNAAQKYPAQQTRATLSVREGSLTLYAKQSEKTIAWNQPGAPVVVFMPDQLAQNEDASTMLLYDKSSGKTVAHSFYADGWVYGAVEKPGTYDAKSIHTGFADTETH